MHTGITYVQTLENNLTSQNLGSGDPRTAISARTDQGEAIDVPVVACILAPDGSLIAEAGNTREADADPTGHAEIIAIRMAARKLGDWRLDGLTIYSSLEPCLMCSSVIREARLSKVLFSISSESQSLDIYDVLRDTRLPGRAPEVNQLRGDLLDSQPQALQAFFQKLRKKRN